MVELFHRFGIPHEFTAERARSTSHSFGRRSDDSNCFSSWFRFSGISAEAGADDECLSVEVDAAEGASSPDKYPEQQSAFFLRTSNDASTTLVCFGARLGVRRRMKDLIKSRGWADVGINPYVLFDVVLEGLYEEVDSTASKLVREFASLERVCIVSLFLSEYPHCPGATDINLVNSPLFDSETQSVRLQALENCTWSRDA